MLLFLGNESVAETLARMPRSDVVILDNLAAHTSKRVAEICRIMAHDRRPMATIYSPMDSAADNW